MQQGACRGSLLMHFDDNNNKIIYGVLRPREHMSHEGCHSGSVQITLNHLEFFYMHLNLAKSRLTDNSCFFFLFFFILPSLKCSTAHYPTRMCNGSKKFRTCCSGSMNTASFCSIRGCRFDSPLQQPHSDKDVMRKHLCA